MSETESKQSRLKQGFLLLFSVLFLGLLTFACVWAWTPTFTNASNTLEQNGRWRVGKMELADGMMGAKSFYGESQALAGQRLNLGAWHGFQRVIMREAIQASSIGLKYKFLPQEDYLFILLNYSDEGFDALKIPWDPWVPAELAHVKHTGEFITSQAFDLPGREPDTWNTAMLTLEPERVGVSVNGAPITWLDLKLETKQNFGFQSGSNGVLLDNIVVRGEAGQILFRETFEDEVWRGTVQKRLVLAVIGGCLVLALVMRLLGISVSSIPSNLIALQLSLTAGGLVISHIYLPTMSAQYPSVEASVRDEEMKLSTENAQRVTADLAARYPTKAPAGTIRIIVVGTSQTAGMGKAQIGEGLVDELERNLNKSGGACRYECVKFGCFGSWSGPLLADYKKLAPQMSPDVCILNLSCNDSLEERRPHFADNLRKFVEYNREHGIMTVFAKEAVYMGVPEISENHKAMQSVAAELGVPVVEPHRFLARRINFGLLWWDFVHPTSFGHTLIAEAMADKLRRVALPKLCEKVAQK